MSDDDFRRMSESQLIDMTLAVAQSEFGSAERMRYARAQAELNRRNLPPRQVKSQLRLGRLPRPVSREPPGCPHHLCELRLGPRR